MRRFAALKGNESIGTASSNAFSVRYLQSIFHKPNTETFEVSLTRAVLEVARQDGREAGFAILDKFPKNLEVETARIALHRPVGGEAKQKRGYCDQYLISAPLVFEGWAKRKRDCYEEILANLNIKLPFDKSDMLQLLKTVEPKFQPRKVTDFGSLSEFIWTFVSKTWPFFDSSVLHIPLSYFRFEVSISPEEMHDHLELMEGYGLERLLGRLIVLQAVCNVKSARDAVLAGGVLEVCEYTPDQEEFIYHFLNGNDVEIEEYRLHEIGANNPIERATYLAIYLASASSSFQLMSRIVDVYCIDPTVIGLVEWDKHSKLIRKAAKFATPELVAMAAILSEVNALNAAPNFKSLYVPTGASTHLLAYARHARTQKKLTAHQFFSSFSKQPINVQRVIFTYLLKPGVLDTIANVFPSSSKLIDHVERDDAINALSLKLDCISYLNKRGLLKRSLLRSVDESTRQRLRQVKYESEIKSGRIRLNSKKMSQEILNFSIENYHIPFSSKSSADAREQKLRSIILEQTNRHFSEELANHICFRSKMAFDYLLSNLRHNFLRFKLESTIDDAFHGHRNVNVVPLKKCIETPLNNYCKIWLTISKDRSFFAELEQEIYNFLKGRYLTVEDDYINFSNYIYEMSKYKFDCLLQDCKRVWTTQVRLEVINEVMTEYGCSNFGEDTGISEALSGGLENAFADTEGWLSINDKPIRDTFALRELFLFEATNYSTAKTRRKPFEVHCYDASTNRGTPALMARDVLISGELFDPLVQLIHNLLENAYKHSALAIANTSISVSILDLGDDKIRIEFRNNFNSSRRLAMSEMIGKFRKKLNELKSQASAADKEAPIQTGGSGVKRIFFEFHSLLGENFLFDVSDDEIGQDRFLVICEFPNTVHT